MTYDLFIGDRTYSSWSLRGWLMLEAFGLPCRTHMVGLYAGTLARDLAALTPARTVPVLRTPEGHVIGDSLAMAETLAERHPEVGLWPADPGQRALARWLAAEMHCGFAALRAACPMDLAQVWEGFVPAPDVLADLARIEQLWATARRQSGSNGPWLFGAYSLADVFFAPVAARITTYGLPVSDAGAAYVAAHLNDAAFRSWRSAGLNVALDPSPHAQPLPRRPWPQPTDPG